MADVRATARDAAGGAQDLSERLGRSRGYQVLVAVGLVCFGVVHLLIAWLALQVAWGGGGEADQQGALRTLAQTGVGPVLLVVVAVGMATLVVWQAIEAAWGHTHLDGAKRVRRRLSSAARAVVYAAIAVSAARLVVGARGSSSSGQQEETLTSRLLALPAGRVLVLMVAATVVAVGVSQVVKGVKGKFADDLTGDKTAATLRLGTAGYCAKGVALAVVGALFAWAAIGYDPDRAGGLDSALQTVRDQPAGAVLLTVLALGFAAFGVFCFVWARNART